jgi:hypothetical protein
MSEDEDIMSFLESDRTVYVKTPRGYTLDTNTLCVNGEYQNFNGNLKHSKLGVLAVKDVKTSKVGKRKRVGKKKSNVISAVPILEPQADGSINEYEQVTTEVTTKFKQKIRKCTALQPFMKAYCRNVVSGDKFMKCKVKTKKSKKTRKVVSRNFVRTIPAPKNSTETPPPPPSPPVTEQPKDSTETPPPPAEAPGPNPAPSPDDPNPGAWQCYSLETGASVQPRADGTCPAGSFGGPA